MAAYSHPQNLSTTVHDEVRKGSLLLLPREHGAWGIVLIPFLTAAAITKQMSPEVLLALVAVLLVFIGRYPLELLLIPVANHRAGHPARQQVWFSFWVYAIAAAITGFVLVFIFELFALLWLALLGGLFFALRVWQGRRGADRDMIAEVFGSVGLTLSALVAWVAATGGVDQAGWLVWILNAVFFASGIVYVKSKIRSRLALHNLEAARTASCSMCFQLLVLLFVVALVFVRWVAPLVVVPFALASLRAAWGLHDHSSFTLRRLGWSEVALSLVFATFLALGFLF
jgi:hypothetical protein